MLHTCVPLIHPTFKKKGTQCMCVVDSSQITLATLIQGFETNSGIKSTKENQQLSYKLYYGFMLDEQEVHSYARLPFVHVLRS